MSPTAVPAAGEQQATATVPVGMPAHWWAPGLHLAERLALPGTPAADPGQEPADRARRRVERWRTAYRLDRDGRFERRLAELGIEEADLTALLAEPAQELAGRASLPGWAARAEEVLAAMPPQGELPEGGVPPGGHAGLTLVVAPFARHAVDELAAAVRPKGWTP
ncbi:hypothetical protein [Nonomuraea antimicrobica]|uniref:hypothetical protein n=1 Tax=Nonomuraea antimicrobica TaxID=561173 RepID=UPI0031E9EAF8